ncbi:hypothetical protein E2C01_084275 [Portunus trituberculatus]|uniref:Uncharacterized protein n=1 Tax=Portunus trituberculatus TaxID=210409 RepID=A0A5B7J3K9_PORTR|nr:hypothetical protein [Portunus trituberculatus]
MPFSASETNVLGLVLKFARLPESGGGGDGGSEEGEGGMATKMVIAAGDWKAQAHVAPLESDDVLEIFVQEMIG